MSATKHIYALSTVVLILLMFQGVLSAQISHRNEFMKVPDQSLFRGTVKFPRPDKLMRQDIDASADSYEYVGSNLIAKGHVVIRTRSMQITGNTAVINMKNNDAELSGNVVFSAEASVVKIVDRREYDDLVADPTMRVKLLRTVREGTGRRKFEIEIKTNVAYMQAERISGNLETGVFQFRKFTMKAADLFVSGDLAERYADGTIRVMNGKTSTCEYLLDSHAHYAIGAQEMILKPRESARGIFNYNTDQGEHSILAKNSLLYLWNVPVFWFPALYKPRDFSSFGGRIEFGKSSDFGFFFRLRKDMDILDEPARVKGGILLDYYAERGFGYGASLDILTPESSTEFFMYAIRDRNPYKGWESDYGENPGMTTDGKLITDDQWVKLNARLEIPKNRYEFRLSNLTYFTPELSFRGSLDVISDYRFLEDYFPTRFNQDIQPPTFAALDYQGERFSAVLQTAVKVNSFDSVMERLPEFRLDFHRQELFKNIYYQGQTSVGYYKMNWREFDYKRIENPNLDVNQLVAAAGSPGHSAAIANAYNEGRITKQEALNQLNALYPNRYGGYLNELKKYESARFDTLHALYYPMRFFDSINFIPRVAGRFTAYSRSSDTSITVDDLYTMLSVNDINKWPDANLFVKSYDTDGGAKYRFAFEVGAELNTKIYRAWQTPKSALFEIDGLRHVMVPYINYTFIPDPSVSYKNILYFDDVDQLDRQNFFRFGLVNRLQTRRDSKVQEWFSMENYWDFHFNRDYGFNNIGDFATVLSFTPCDGVSLVSKLILDVGRNNDHDYVVNQGTKYEGRPGLSSDIINRWETTLSYKFSKDWKVFASYMYSDAYKQRSTYSMASTLTALNATTNFAAYFDRHQYITAGLHFPTYIDEKLHGLLNIQYNVDQDLVEEAGILLTRNFHCWYLQAGTGVSFTRNNNDDKVFKYYLNVAMGLSAMPGVSLSAKFDGESSNYRESAKPDVN